MKVSFTLNKRGKEVTFRDTSREVPVGSSYLWDFGVENGTSTEKNPPPFTYDEQGFYVVTLTITPPQPQEPQSTYETLGISDSGLPTLSDSIYNLIEYYIPDDLVKYITNRDKRVYIEKWQLYLQPLVNHEVPLEEYSNEFAYSALENQLIMELAAYDWMVTGIMSLMRSVTNLIEEGSSSSTDSEQSEDTSGNVKKIVTGPSEVEFFETQLTGEDVSSLTKTMNSALQPGGLLDTIKSNICMLSQRLDIYLPICNQVGHTVLPKVGNRRKPGLLGGPNPTFPINK